MMRSIVRTAAKPHTCGRCRGPIPAGTRHREFRLSPDHDGLGNIDWVRDRECATCADTCERAVDTDPHTAPSAEGLV